MDASLFRQEFEASIESLLGAIYPDFSRASHARDAKFDPAETDAHGPEVLGAQY